MALETWTNLPFRGFIAAIADGSLSVVDSNAAIWFFPPDSGVTGAREVEAISQYHTVIDLNERRRLRSQKNT